MIERKGKKEKMATERKGLGMGGTERNGMEWEGSDRGSEDSDLIDTHLSQNHTF